MQMRGPANVRLVKRVLSGHGVRRSFQGVYARSCQPLWSNPRRRGRQPVEVPRTGRTHIIFLICHTAMRTVTSCLSVTQLWWNFRVQVRHIDSLKRVFLSPIQRVSWPLSRHVSFMRMCDCHVFHILPHFCIFQQSAHITYFFLNKLAFLMAIFTARCYASAVLAMGLCLCLSVCLSVTSRSSTKTAKRHTNNTTR